jgi:hypothetical protein
MVRYFINSRHVDDPDNEEYHEVVRVGQPEGYASYLGQFCTYEMALECVKGYIDWVGGVLDGEEDNHEDLE